MHTHKTSSPSRKSIRLQKYLESQGIKIKQSVALEAIAHSEGFSSWNEMSTVHPGRKPMKEEKSSLQEDLGDISRNEFGSSPAGMAAAETYSLMSYSEFRRMRKKFWPNPAAEDIRKAIEETQAFKTLKCLPLELPSSKTAYYFHPDKYETIRIENKPTLELCIRHNAVFFSVSIRCSESKESNSLGLLAEVDERDTRSFRDLLETALKVAQGLQDGSIQPGYGLGRTSNL